MHTMNEKPKDFIIRKLWETERFRYSQTQMESEDVYVPFLKYFSDSTIASKFLYHAIPGVW